MEISQQDKIETDSAIAESLPSESERLVKLSLKTLYSAFVLLALFMTLFVLIFPYTAMKTYMKTGMKFRALECADRYYNVHVKDYASSQPPYDSKFADVLYAGVNLSASLLDKELNKNGGAKAVKSIAESADKFASGYLSYASLYDRTRVVDEYSLAHSQPSMHASVYSFENTVAVLREKSRFILKGTEYSLGYFFDAMRDDLLINNGNFEITEESADKYIRLFNQLSAIIEYELNGMDFYSKARFSPNGGLYIDSVAEAKFDFDGTQFSLLYLRSELALSENGQVFVGKSPLLKWASSQSQLENDSRGIEYWLPKTVEFVRSYAPRNRAEWAKKLFWAKSLSELTERASYALSVMDCNLEAYNESMRKGISETADIWDELGYIDMEGHKITLADWYRFNLLPEYTAYTAASAN